MAASHHLGHALRAARAGSTTSFPYFPTRPCPRWMPCLAIQVHNVVQGEHHRLWPLIPASIGYVAAPAEMRIDPEPSLAWGGWPSPRGEAEKRERRSRPTHANEARHPVEAGSVREGPSPHRARGRKGRRWTAWSEGRGVFGVAWPHLLWQPFLCSLPFLPHLPHAMLAVARIGW